MSLTLKIFQAQKGDAIDISFIDPTGISRHIMVDSGTMGSYKLAQRPVFEKYPATESIDLWILTHLDADHIAGALDCFREGAKKLPKGFIKQVWFNFFGDFKMADSDDLDISMDQAISLRDSLNKIECKNIHNNINNELDPIVFCGATITILSPDLTSLEQLKVMWEDYERGFKDPTPPEDVAREEYPDDLLTIKELSTRKDRKEDHSDIPNKSSIAFLLEYNGESILMLGDSHPSIVIDAIKNLNEKRGLTKLPITYLKIAHHGSIDNHSNMLLDVIECQNFIVSTDGNNHDQNPNKETLAKVLTRNNMEQHYKFYFNYRPERYDKLFEVDNNAEVEYNFSCIYPQSGKRFLQIPIE